MPNPYFTLCSSIHLIPSLFAGPVAQKVSEQHAKTSAELSSLAASRQTPANPAATGQPLTHYHSFFSELLSWKNPRTYYPRLPALLIHTVGAEWGPAP